MSLSSIPSLPMIVGRYELRAIVARGGMATVYLGRLTGVAGFSRAVAIKRLHPQFVSDPGFVAMFSDEARLAASIHSPHVVSVNDVVMHEGELLLIMDFVHGVSLNTLLQAARKKGLDVSEGIMGRIVCDTLIGLHAAHEARDGHGQPLSIVHRDVSPHNILVDAAGIARVIDFGVAKAATRLQNTQEGQLKGKLYFMAPEQLRGGRVDRRADIYAVAGVLWNALANRGMYDFSNDASLIYAILEGKRPRLATVAPKVSNALQAIIEKGLSIQPKERFATAAQMAEAIEYAVDLASERDVAQWITQLTPSELKRLAALRFDVESPVVASPASLSSLASVSLETTSVKKKVEALPASETSKPNTTKRNAAFSLLFATLFLVSLLLSAVVAWVVAHPTVGGDVKDSPSPSSEASLPAVEASKTKEDNIPAASASLPDVVLTDETPTSSAPLPAASPPPKKRKYYGF